MLFFDLIPNLIASFISILLPSFLSYKALRTSDPALLSPWLMYWVTLSLLLTAESYAWLLTMFIPFYSTLRILPLFILMLPQTQGARILYQSYIHPFLAHHEAQIEERLAELVERVKALGGEHLITVVTFVKREVLRMRDPPEDSGLAYGHYPGASNTSAGSASGAAGYAAGLLARFSLPSASSGLAAPAGDLYGLLSAAAGILNKPSSEQPDLDPLLRSGTTLIPAQYQSPADKARFVAQQQEKLRVLLAALDREAGRLEQEHGPGMGRSKSAASFERIEAEEGEDTRGTDGGWLGWAQGAWKGAQGEEGRSSGVER